MSEKFVAIYARQSVDKKDSISIESQIDLCRAEASGEYQVYEDKGFSGKNTKRPAFERLMKAVEAGHVSKLVCYRLDRISRSISDFGRIWEMLSRNSVEFVSVNEKFDTSTPVGRAMLYIIMVFAQLERETIAERIKDNYYQRVKKGAWPGGPAPYGFQISSKRVAGSKTLEPTAEIDVVKRIFDLYAVSGSSLGKVAKLLTQENIPCAKRRSWDSISVFRVLRSPVYVKANVDVYIYYKNKGMIIFNEPEEFVGQYAGLIIGKRPANERKFVDVSDHLFVLSNHTGIIEPSQFLTCQYKLDGNKQLKNTGKGKLTWLSGLLHCAECGYSMRVLKDRDSGKLRLYCNGHTHYYICDVRHTETVEKIESDVEQHIIQYIIESQTQSTDDKNTESVDLNAIKLELLQIDEKISNLVKALSEGSAVTMKYINSEIERLESEKLRVVGKLSELSVSNNTHAPLWIDFPSLSFEDKKAVAAMFIKTIKCSPDDMVVIRK
jgi:DNA invertase Pin-like site-specific DNA recombinase